jgi:23S rRNA pseudouridine1911/1915/1917 synthase
MTKEFIVDETIRLDKFLSAKLLQNRNQIEQLIKKGFVDVNNKAILKTGLKLKLGQKIVITIPIQKIKEARKVNFDIEVIYEDEEILVINKPSGVIIHDAPSVNEPTLVDWLKKRNISLSTISGEQRDGIVHRLDKGTSGVLVVAKTNKSHVKLSKQLENKTMGRYYLAISNLPLKDNTIIDKPIARSQNNRLKMGIVTNGRVAKTAFKKLILNKNTKNTSKKYELICAKLYTGRTHQIRVHLESINRSILGDNLYGFKGNNSNIKRIYLHAFCLYLIHPKSNKLEKFVANIPDDMMDFIQNNFDKELIDEKINMEYIINSFDNINKWMYCT